MRIFARPEKMHKPRTGCIDDNFFTYSLPGRGYSKYWMQVSYNKFALPVHSVFSFITCKIIARILPKVWELINHSVIQHFPHKLFCKCFLLRSTIIRHNNQLTRSISSEHYFEPVFQIRTILTSQNAVLYLFVNKMSKNQFVTWIWRFSPFLRFVTFTAFILVVFGKNAILHFCKKFKVFKYLPNYFI